MANVMFKRGTQAKLSSLKSFVDGAFYLTTDTDRLYVAQSSTELVELNKSITIVNDVGDLPATTAATDTAVKGADVAVGQFYYVKAGASSKSGNVLAVCSAISPEGAITWTQVNPDTNTNNVTRLTSVDVSVAEDKKTYTLTINWSMDNKAQTAITKEFTIDPTTVISIGLTSPAIADGVAYITTTGAGANAGSKVGIKTGGGGITIGKDKDNPNVITIAGTVKDYSMALDATTKNKLVLKTGNEAKGSLTIAGSGKITATGDTTNNTVTIAHKDSGVTADKYGPTANAKLSALSEFTVPELTVDAQGHVTSANNRTLTLPDNVDHYVTDGSIAAGTDGQVNITLNRGGTSSLEKIAIKDNIVNGKAVIHNTITVDGTPKVVNNAGDFGSFYSAATIDEKFRSLDAFTYKGTVGTNGTVTSLPTTKVSNGDSYKAIEAGTFGGIICAAGDILIAMGTEGKDGYLTEISWTKVQGNTEMDTQYKLTSDVAGLKLTTTSGASKTYTIPVSGTNGIGVNTADNKIVINHNTIGKADTYGEAPKDPTTITPTNLSHGGTFYVPVVTTDAQGHVSTAKTVGFKLPGDNNTTYTLEPKTASDANSFILKDSGNATKGTVKFAGDGTVGLTVTGSGNAITVTGSHKAYTARSSANQIVEGQSEKALAFGEKFTVPYITSDATGHVTGIANQTIKLPANVDTKYTISGSTGYKDNIGTFTTTLQAVGGAATSITHKIKSNTLTMSASGDTLTADLVWGTF